MQRMQGRKPRPQGRVSRIARWQELRFWILEKSPSFIASPHWTLLGTKKNTKQKQGRFNMLSNCGFKATGYRNSLDLHARFYKPRNFSKIDGAAIAESLSCSWLIKDSKMVSCMRLMFLSRLLISVFKELYLNWPIYLFYKTLSFWGQLPNLSLHFLLWSTVTKWVGFNQWQMN